MMSFNATKNDHRKEGASMLMKSKLRFLEIEETVTYKSGDLMVAAFDVIEHRLGGIRTLRDVGAKLLVADLELGFELKVEVVSTRKLRNS
jgi:hypothetical protein